MEQKNKSLEFEWSLFILLVIIFIIILIINSIFNSGCVTYSSKSDNNSTQTTVVPAPNGNVIVF